MMSLVLPISNPGKVKKYAEKKNKQTIGGREGGKDQKAQKESGELWAQLFIKPLTRKMLSSKAIFLLQMGKDMATHLSLGSGAVQGPERWKTGPEFTHSGRHVGPSFEPGGV